MKRRLFSLLLVLAILSTLPVAPVNAWSAEENVTKTTEVCPCGCDKTVAEIQWRAYDPNTDGAPTSGHYYLDGNYVQNGQLEIMSGDRVVIDLRGNTLTTSGYTRLFLVYGYLAVMDTVGGGLFMSKTSGGGYGGIVMVSTNETNDTAFELYSGTVMPDPDNKGSRRGGLIHLSETASFRMYGGRLMNGTTVNVNEKKEPGGCVAGASAACTIEILGGEIIGGQSSTFGGNIYNVGTTVLKNCKIIGGTSAKSGGNICQNGGSLTIENCTISDGVSNDTSNGGGNICTMTSTVMTLKDSTVRNGYSAYHGGNIYMDTSSGTLDNCVVEAGVAANRGGNIYGASSAAGLTIRNCEIPGDVAYVGAGLKLEGLVKIGLLNNGLKLWYSDEYHAAVSAAGLTEGSEIYVDANHTFTEAGANAAYFKGAMRTVLSETDDGLAGTYAAAGEQGGYCPHCGDQVTWKEFSLTDSLVQECLLDEDGDTDAACTGRHIESGHYYLTGSLTGMSQQYIGVYLSGTQAAKDVVVDLAGYSLSATGRAFYLRPANSDAGVGQSSLTMLDSYGGGVVTGRGANNQGGGVIYNEGSKLTIYGGKYVYDPVDGRNVTGGGVIQGGYEFTMHGGILDGSAFTYTDASTDTKTYTYYGGALSMGNGSNKNFTMTAGRIIGGTAQSAGAAYFGYNNIVNITGGQFYGGVADKTSGGGGGAIRMYGTSSYKSAVFNMSGASVVGGSVTGTSAGGGNMSLAYGTIEVKNCYIADGSVAGYGGNITCGTSSNITFTDCIIEGGTSAGQSGNIHVASTSATTNWTNCLLIGGTATAYGGNITCGNGYNTVKGGQILFGTAGSYGGNIVATAGNVSATSTNYTTVCADDAGNVPSIAGGTAGTYGGNLYVGGVTNVQAAQFIGGTAGTVGQDIYMNKASKQNKLALGGDVTGNISLGVNSALLGENVYGEAIDRTECTTLNATVTLEGDYSGALLCAKEGMLYVGTVAVFDSDGNIAWYTEVADAVAACGEDSYIKFFIDGEVVLTKDCALDLNGNTVNISGAYTAKVMDSTGGGTAVLAEGTKSAAEFVAPDGIRYLSVAEGTNVTAHPLDMKITGVSLRTSSAGIYYTGTWIADEVTSGLIESYGVAVSTAGAPNDSFMQQGSQCLWTTQTDALDKDTENYSVLIAGIMKTLDEDPDRTAAKNKANGETEVHAAAYVKLTNGTVLVSDSVSYSLYDVMQTVDGLIDSDPINYRKYTNTMRDFYDAWDEFGMGQWSFNKSQPPVDDGVIDVLMIGSSFCYYYVEELCGLAEAAGIEMRVCNVYYSGCPLEKHYNWWINGESNYQFFDTTYDGGRKQTNNVSLEWCLAQGEWDVISLQESSSATFNDPDHLETTRTYYTTLINYLTEQFPDAMMSWHQVWTYQVGYDRNGYQMTSFEQQQTNMESVKAYCKAICEEFGIQRINTGEAWQIVRSEYGYDNLCARLGKGDNHEGDYYHDGDIGGGQYLNACIWFEIITGESCVGNTYAPTYTYGGVTYELDSDITYAELQEAAHKAVETLRQEEAAAAQ